MGHILAAVQEGTVQEMTKKGKKVIITFKGNDDDDDDEGEEEEPSDHDGSGTDEEDDGWEQIYAEERLDLPQQNSVYYHTYGGGPSGGYCRTPLGQVYSWEQNWGTRKEMTLLDDYVLLFKDYNWQGMAAMVKAVPPGLMGGAIFIELRHCFLQSSF